MSKTFAVGLILALSVGFVFATPLSVSANDDVVADSPVITTPSLPNGTVGVEYNQTLQAENEAPVTYKIEEGVLPSGLSMSDDGVITGTSNDVGTYGFKVSAKSEDNRSSSVWFAITMQQDAETVPPQAAELQNTTAANDSIGLQNTTTANDNMELQNTTAADNSVVKDSAFIGTAYDHSDTNENVASVQTNNIRTAVSRSNFGDVPQTGVFDVYKATAAMCVLIMVSIISWVYVFFTKSRRYNNDKW